MSPLAKLPSSQRAIEPGEWNFLQDGAKRAKTQSSKPNHIRSNCKLVSGDGQGMILVTGIVASTASLFLKIRTTRGWTWKFHSETQENRLKRKKNIFKLVELNGFCLCFLASRRWLRKKAFWVIIQKILIIGVISLPSRIWREWLGVANCEII